MHVVDFCVLGQSVILKVWQSTRRCWVVLVWVEKNPAYVDLKFRRIEGGVPMHPVRGPGEGGTGRTLASEGAVKGRMCLLSIRNSRRQKEIQAGTLIIQFELQ